MALYVELVTDAFDTQFADKTQNTTSAGAGLTSVRRPTRGLEVKDETHAYIKLVRVDGSEIPIFDSSASGGMGTSYANFILQSVVEQRMEKHQVIDTFGESYVFFFGEAPRFLNVQAMLINSLDFNWKDEFLANYDTYLRGTKAVEQGARTYLFYDSNIVEGYILNCQVSDSSDQPFLVPMSFQFFVTNAQSISLIGEGSENFPIRSSALIPDGVDLTSDPGGESLDTLVSAQTSNTESSFANGNYNRTSPIRSLILDNKDEYTSAIQPTLMDLADDITARATAEQNAITQSVDNLETATSDILSAYGAENAYDPFLMDSLGIGPTFLNTGVGIGSSAGQAGAFATFGATANAQAGAFAGGGVGIGALPATGFSSSGSAFSGVTAGATNGVSVGANFGLSVGITDDTYLQSQTSRDGYAYQTPGGAYANASALASANALVPGSTSYSYSNPRAAALAGGYAGAGGYLSFGGQALPMASSYAGARGSAGASVSVGGESSAFSFVAVQGTLQNAGLSAMAALSAMQSGVVAGTI